MNPSRVRAGSRVKGSGNVAGGCARGDTVALLSRAFTNTYCLLGSPRSTRPSEAAEGFGENDHPASRKAGNYTITGRCGGGNLGVRAHLRVRNQ